MHKILQRQELEYQIFVINQVGNDPFNRAKLLNVGFIEALKLYDWDCFVFHDVDLGKINSLEFLTLIRESRKKNPKRGTSSIFFRGTRSMMVPKIHGLGLILIYQFFFRNIAYV